MTLFVTGLIGFFGLHLFSALRSRAPERDLRKRVGEPLYRGVFSVLSVASFVALLFGYGAVREAEPIWIGPDIARSLTLPLNCLALILLAAAYMPVGRIKRAVHHPMMLATLIWALSHVAIGGDGPKLILFGAFAIYSAVSLMAAFSRGERVVAAPRALGDGLAIGIGVIATLILWHGGHAVLTGHPPS